MFDKNSPSRTSPKKESGQFTFKENVESKLPLKQRKSQKEAHSILNDIIDSPNTQSSYISNSFFKGKRSSNNNEDIIKQMQSFDNITNSLKQKKLKTIEVINDTEVIKEHEDTTPSPKNDQMGT